MYGWTDSSCVLQDLVSFGAAALLPLKLNHTLHKQGTGTADHLLPFGCYCNLQPLSRLTFYPGSSHFNISSEPAKTIKQKLKKSKKFFFLKNQQKIKSKQHFKSLTYFCKAYVLTHMLTFTILGTT